MSVAAEFAPEVYIPSRAYQPGARPVRDRHLRVVQAPVPVGLVVPPARRATAPAAVPLRLTRRGIAVIALAVALLGAALVFLAWQSAPAPASAPAVPASLSVEPGETLWSIAGRIAPGRDARAEVAELQRLNGLAGVDLQVGQRLRTR